MTDWPGLIVPHGPTVVSFGSPEACGLELGAVGNAPFNIVSGVWPTANRALLVPFQTSDWLSIVQMWWANGSAVSGNVDAGIYDEAFNRLGHTGSVAQAGTSVLQGAAMVLTLPPGGRYYMALVADNTTATFLRVTPNAASLSQFGVVQMSAAFPLPATVTPIFNTFTAAVWFGATQRNFL